MRCGHGGAALGCTSIPLLASIQTPTHDVLNVQKHMQDHLDAVRFDFGCHTDVRLQVPFLVARCDVTV